MCLPELNFGTLSKRKSRTKERRYRQYIERSTDLNIVETSVIECEEQLIIEDKTVRGATGTFNDTGINITGALPIDGY